MSESSVEAGLCSICQEAIGEGAVTTTACGHQFHTACLAEWESNQHTNRCPNCNAALHPGQPIHNAHYDPDNYAPPADADFAGDVEAPPVVHAPAIPDTPVQNVWVLPAGVAPAHDWSNAVIRGADGTAGDDDDGGVLIRLTLSAATGTVPEGDGNTYDLYRGDGNLVARNAGVRLSDADRVWFQCQRHDYLV